MSYITTYTGKHFDPIQPEPGLFDLTDISHALSLLCRGNGHMKHFLFRGAAQHRMCGGGEDTRIFGKGAAWLSFTRCE